MLNIRLTDEKSNAEYSQAVKSIKKYLGKLSKSDRLSFLAFLAVTLKLHIDGLSVAEGMNAINAPETTWICFQRLKKNYPDCFEAQAISLYHHHFKEGLGEPSEPLASYVLMLFAQDAFFKEMESRGKVAIFSNMFEEGARKSQ